MAARMSAGTSTIILAGPFGELHTWLASDVRVSAPGLGAPREELRLSLHPFEVRYQPEMEAVQSHALAVVRSPEAATVAERLALAVLARDSAALRPLVDLVLESLRC